MTAPFPSFPSASGTIGYILLQVKSETISVRELMTMMGEHGLLMLCALMTLPFVFPVSIPGVSTVFGAAILLIGVAVTLNTLPWLPAFVADKRLDWHKLQPVLQRGVRFLKKVDGYLKPHRLAVLSQGAVMNRLNGCALIFAAIMLMMPLGLVPFSNTLPAVAILFLAVGMSQRDGAVVAAGYVMNVATVIYFGFLAWAAWKGGTSLIG